MTAIGALAHPRPVMRSRLWPALVVALALGACATDSAPAPSCTDATAHYYAAGCVYRSGSAVQPEADVRRACVDLYAQEPTSCAATIDEWTRCMAAVSASSCDCSAELEAAAVCK